MNNKRNKVDIGFSAFYQIFLYNEVLFDALCVYQIYLVYIERDKK